MADGSVIIDTSLDPSGFEQGIGKLGSIAAGGMKATATAVTAVTGALSACASYCIKVGSDFEAGMSQVEAISSASSQTVITASGNIVDGLSALTEKAKEMGSTTKFSATESAEALNYMAMAGWDSQAMYDGLAGVMTLAAASGQDLASTADIITDALTAFGMSAGDAGGFADVLAQVSASANTNVELLGETFKYVAPLCGTLGFSAEDAAVAIGLMANSGIKGSQAGTSLKTALANLAAPTKQMAVQMDALGISLNNADGTSKSLMDVLVNLREGFSTLSASEQTAAASTIFGKEAMSGMLAVINASDEDFAALTESIYNCDGAAEHMAETMQDNLQGKLTTLKSGIEGLGIAVYEQLQAPLKELADKGQEYIQRLSDAFSNGGFSGLFGELGAVLADAVSELVSAAPKMVDAAVSVIQSFGDGIRAATPRLGPALAEIGTALVNGILTIIPQFVSIGFELITSLVSGVASAAPELVSSFSTAISDVVLSIADHLPELLQAGVELLNALADGFIQSMPQIGEAAVTLITTLGSALIDGVPALAISALEIVQRFANFILSNLPMIVQAAVQIMNSLINGIVGKIPSLVPAVIQIMMQITSAIINNLPTIITGAIEIITALATGLISAIPKIVVALPQIIKAIVDGFQNVDWLSVGTNIIAGIASGVSSAAGALVDAAVSAARNAINAVKSWLGIASPSKRAKNEIGKWILPGVGEGVKETSPQLNTQMTAAADDMVNSFSDRVEQKDTSSLIARMKAGVAANISNFTANVTAKSGTGSGQVSGTFSEAIDYGKLGTAVAHGFIEADIRVQCDEREFGRLVAEVSPA